VRGTQRKSTYEKETMPILHVVDIWCPYLLGKCFQIKIDHCNLKYFIEQRIYFLEQQKWVTKMLGYEYEIIYIKGKENVVVDNPFLESMKRKGPPFHSPSY
jgi:hypothetical protein